MVTAHFYVAQITQYSYNPDNRDVVLRPSTKGEINKAWATATPNGEIKLTINNGAASQWFADRMGKDVEITFADLDVS